MQMIQVQIAAALEAEGVSGVRWVLVDPADPTPVPAPERRAEAPAPRVPLAGEPIRRAPLMLNLVAAAVLLAALAGAWWSANALLASREAAVPQATDKKSPARPG